MTRRTIVAATALVLVGTLTQPAVAGRAIVNAARNIVSYDSAPTCAVLVDDYSAYEVEVFCFGSGSTWFTVKLTGVGFGPLTARTFSTGDCTGKSLTVKRRPGGVAIVKVRNTGDFDCTYKSVSVRWP